MGWVNVSIKNLWDWFFILYYLTYCLTGIYLVWKWGKTESSKNKKKQSSIIMRVFFITLIIGAFTESVVNNVFSIRIPQLAPINADPCGVIFLAQRYGLLTTGECG